MSLVDVSRKLAAEVEQLVFERPVEYCYNPLIYAQRPHEAYLRRYGSGKREVFLVGMNPGPFGMAQTGVPFGDVEMVRGWMGISEPVESPEKVHPKRPIRGFDCSRREVSGQRLWGWAKKRFIKPEKLFERFFVWNYCPLCFVEESGRNRTPDKLPAKEKEALFAACDAALRGAVEELSPAFVIGVGAFAAERVRRAVGPAPGVKTGTVLHPSPASPAANRGWEEQFEEGLRALGVALG